MFFVNRSCSLSLTVEWTIVVTRRGINVRKSGIIIEWRVYLHFFCPLRSPSIPYRTYTRMSCSNEAHGHDHSHGHGHGHGHEGHDHDDPEGTGPQDSLYSQIDLTHVTALNASGGPEAGQKIFKCAFLSTTKGTS
jgi:hypothetical protein